MAAEGTLAFHTVKHHQSYKVSDCSTKLYRCLFKDSEVAGKISCARTKTEAIVNNVLAPYSLKITKERMESVNIPYVGVCTDGSNHGATKLFPIVTQFFDKEFGISHALIDLKTVPDEKSATISNIVVTALDEMGVKEKCIAFGGDNCNTNFGGVNRRGTTNVSAI